MKPHTKPYTKPHTKSSQDFSSLNFASFQKQNLHIPTNSRLERLTSYRSPYHTYLQQSNPSIALDSAPHHHNLIPWAGRAPNLPPQLEQSIGFLGYPFLAELSQRAEFRKPASLIARETTREWINLKLSHHSNNSSSQEDNYCHIISQELKKYNIRDIIRRMTEQALLYGSAHLWINFNHEAKTSSTLSLPLYIDKYHIPQNSLSGFKLLEPIWMSALAYNSVNPLADDYYKPSLWAVQQITIHASRLMQMTPYEVSDLYKPAFNFGGLSLSQQLLPYVETYLSMRQSVSHLTTNASKLVLKTSLSSTMSQEDGVDYSAVSAANLRGRATLLQEFSNGQDVIIADKEAEDVSIVSTSLAGLSDLQAHAMEAMASIPSIPLVKLFGLQPAGLNASSDGELRVFYDEIASFQEAHIAPILKRIIEVIEVNKFGKTNPELSFEFVPLWQMDAEKSAQIEKTKAEMDDINIKNGKITPQEARLKQHHDPHNPYHSSDLTKKHHITQAHDNALALDANHKTEQEPRDKNGQWTKGNNASNQTTTKNPKIKENKTENIHINNSSPSTPEGSGSGSETNNSTEIDELIENGAQEIADLIVSRVTHGIVKHTPLPKGVLKKIVKEFKDLSSSKKIKENKKNNPTSHKEKNNPTSHKEENNQTAHKEENKEDKKEKTSKEENKEDKKEKTSKEEKVSNSEEKPAYEVLDRDKLPKHIKPIYKNIDKGLDEDQVRAVALIDGKNILTIILH